MEIKNENGKLKTLDELYDETKEQIIEELDNMDTDDALCLGNEIRDRNHYERLRENDEENINEVLEGEDPWTILNTDWSYNYDYFIYDGDDFDMTDDVWYDLDTEEIAEDIIEGSYHNYITSDIKDILDEYEEAKERIENYNPARAEGEELLKKYVNCEADVVDLLQYIDRLVKNDDVWKEE